MNLTKIYKNRYNGFPNRCDDNNFPWCDNKHLYVCHGEMNAIMNKYASDLEGCTIYAALHPCNECAKMIIHSRISKVVYLSDKLKHQAPFITAKDMFVAAGIESKQFVPRENDKKITIDFAPKEESGNSSESSITSTPEPSNKRIKKL